jgi:predicted membrane protein (TIGR00267 family)
MLERIHFLIRLGHAHKIARRYFVTNGFDGALTLLGLIMGFYSSSSVALPVVINACLGAAIALTVSGLSSAYVSEAAEREQELLELEQALVRDLADSDYGHAARLLPLLIAAVNGLAPLLIALVIISPLWLAQAGLDLPLPPLETSIALAFAILFLLGAFLGTISGRFWLWSGVRTLIIAVLTAAIILLVESYSRPVS